MNDEHTTRKVDEMWSTHWQEQVADLNAAHEAATRAVVALAQYVTEEPTSGVAGIDPVEGLRSALTALNRIQWVHDEIAMRDETDRAFRSVVDSEEMSQP